MTINKQINYNVDGGFRNQFDIMQTVDNKKVFSALSLDKLNFISFSENGISADTIFLVGIIVSELS